MRAVIKKLSALLKSHGNFAQNGFFKMTDTTSDG
jgi:hypothetical protein